MNQCTAVLNQDSCLLDSYCHHHLSSERTVRQQISLTFYWLEHQSTAATAHFRQLFTQVEVPFISFSIKTPQLLLIRDYMQRGGHPVIAVPYTLLAGSECDDCVITKKLIRNNEQNILQLLGFKHKECLEALDDLATSCHKGEVDFFLLCEPEKCDHVSVRSEEALEN